MASAPATHQNEENKLLMQIEEPIASRLRSSCRIRDVQTSHTGEIDVYNRSEDKPSLLSRKQKGKTKSENSVAKESEVHTASTNKTGQPSTDNHKGSEVHTAKKSNGSTPKGSEVHISSSCTRRLPSKDSSETKRKEQDLKNKHAKSKDSQHQSETKACSTGKTSKNSKGQELEKIKSSAPKKSNTGEPPSCSHLGKEKEKTRPSVKFNMKSIKEPTYHIRWKGFGELSTRYNCSLCDKDISYSPNEEKWKYPIHEENELEYSIFSSMVEERKQCAILPEVAILPCSHVFHSTCLSETLMQHSDPPCPICNMF